MRQPFHLGLFREFGESFDLFFHGVCVTVQR
jgi:hypothetical protein